MKKVDTKKERLAINFSEEFEDVYRVKLNNDGLLKIYDMTIQFKKKTIEEAFLIILRRYDDAKEAFTKWGGVCYNLEKEYFEELADDDLIDNTSKDLAKGFQYKPFLLEKWHIDSIESVRISPDGKTIISASRDGNIRLWDIQSGECIGTLSGHEHPIHSVAISLDGKTIVSLSGDSTIKIWDMQSAECINTLIDPDLDLGGQLSNIYPVAVSPDGKTIVSGDYNTLKIWDLGSGECIKKEHAGFVASVVISPDGKTLVSTSTRATNIWDMKSGECINTSKSRSVGVISPDSKTIVFKTLKIWDIRSGKYIDTLEGHKRYVNSVAISSDGKTIVSQSGDELKIWDARSGNCINTLDDLQDIRELISVEGKTIVAYCSDHMSYVDIIDIYNGDRINTLFLQRYRTPVESVAISPDGKTIVSGSLDNPIKIWDIQSSKCIDTVEGHRHLEDAAETMSTYSIAISPDGKTIVSIGIDREIKLWDMQSGECIDTLASDIHYLDPVGISPDSKTIVSLCYMEVMIWDARSGECINTWQHYIEYDNMRGLVAISTDGKTIITKAWNELKIWNVINSEDIECIDTLAGHTREITSIAISPDGKTIVSGDRNHTIKIWNIKTGECTHTIKVHAHKIRSVAISPDGKTIVSGDMNNTIKIWDIKTGECICTIDHDYKVSIDKNGYFNGSVESIDKYIRISEKPLSQRKLTPSEIKHFKRNRFLDL